MSETQISSLMQKTDNLVNEDISSPDFTEEMQKLAMTLQNMLNTCASFEYELGK